MSLSEYVKEVRLAIALNDALGLELLIKRFLVDDRNATLKKD